MNLFSKLRTYLEIHGLFGYVLVPESYLGEFVALNKERDALNIACKYRWKLLNKMSADLKARDNKLDQLQRKLDAALDIANICEARAKHMTSRPTEAAIYQLCCDELRRRIGDVLPLPELFTKISDKARHQVFVEYGNPEDYKNHNGWHPHREVVISKHLAFQNGVDFALWWMQREGLIRDVSG